MLKNHPQYQIILATSLREWIMENPVHCPKCQSTHISLRDHEQHLKKIGGILMTSAGATAGTVGGAASGASIGAAIGALAGPLGFVVGGTVGTFVGAVGAGVTGGVIGNFLGKKVGVTVDRNLFLDYQCLDCKHRFKAETKQPADQKEQQ